MADWTHDAEMFHTEQVREDHMHSRIGLTTQIAGAVVSVALLVGMGVWGYKLVVRDVHGVPVVRAMGGPMREAPADPGGELALHTGLAVNEVAALGEAADPEDTLVLAPVTADLTEEDLMAQPTAEAGEVIAAGVALSPEVAAEEPEPIRLSRDGADPMTEADILALADQITAGVEPLGDLSDAPQVTNDAIANAVGEAMAGLEVTGDDVTASDAAGLGNPEGGLQRALRPPSRPGSLVVSSASVSVPSASSAETGTADTGVAVSTAPIPAGTVLVQLGAYDSPEMAGQAWTQLAGEFAEFMEGRDRLIQEATSGGRAFYRLRATGFADIDAARRFCSALVAEDAACIPVVVR